MVQIGRIRWALLLLLAACAQLAPQGSLGGTSWQLVKFQGGDGTVLVPDDKAKYTLAFAADGSDRQHRGANAGRGS